MNDQHATLAGNPIIGISAGRVSDQMSRPAGYAAVHDFMVLTFVTAGRVVVRQCERYAVSTGDVYLIPAGVRHSLISAESPEAWSVAFSPACFGADESASLMDPFARTAGGASSVVPIPGDRHEHLARLILELSCETAERSASAHAELVQRNYLGLILAEVSRAGSAFPHTAPSIGLVGDALRFIERKCLGPLALEDVATHVRRSPSHVSTTVRRATGKSVLEWIITCRLAEARRRLRYTDERVDIVAERVGYADPTHFIRIFRRLHGSTPAAWRSRQRNAPGIAPETGVGAVEPMSRATAARSSRAPT